jgi:hypothetical protein
VSTWTKQDARHTQAYTSSCYDYDYNSTITVLVGHEEQQFTVHKDTICAKSKFFRAARSERWNRLSEGKEKAIKLPETSVRDFQIYVHWVYTSKIEVDSGDATKTYADHLQAYILGDVLDDYQLRNAAMEQLINGCQFSKVQSTHELPRKARLRAYPCWIASEKIPRQTKEGVELGKPVMC